MVGDIFFPPKLLNLTFKIMIFLQMCVTNNCDHRDTQTSCDEDSECLYYFFEFEENSCHLYSQPHKTCSAYIGSLRKDTKPCGQSKYSGNVLFVVLVYLLRTIYGLFASKLNCYGKCCFCLIQA